MSLKNYKSCCKFYVFSKLITDHSFKRFSFRYLEKLVLCFFTELKNLVKLQHVKKNFISLNQIKATSILYSLQL